VFNVIQTLLDYQSINNNSVGTADTHILSHVPTAVTWIGFRRCNPDEHTVKVAMDSLDTEGGSSDTLEKVKDCVYPK
jgi:hypothetical protein